MARAHAVCLNPPDCPSSFDCHWKIRPQWMTCPTIPTVRSLLMPMAPKSIKVLKGLDAVRKRPGMYIGDTDDGSGLHHMVYEVVDNAIDEALAGHADRVTVTLNADGSVHRDRQRARHPDGHPRRGRRFGRRGHHDPAACGREVRPELLQGVRRSARRRRVRRQRALAMAASCASGANGKEHAMEFRHGDDRRAARRRRRCRRHRRGTEVTFLPSTETFTMIEFDYDTLEHRLRELAFLNSGVAHRPDRRAPRRSAGETI